MVLLDIRNNSFLTLKCQEYLAHSIFTQLYDCITYSFNCARASPRSFILNVLTNVSVTELSSLSINEDTSLPRIFFTSHIYALLLLAEAQEKETNMGLPMIYPPFNDEEIHLLMNAPVALHVDGNEDKRGIIVAIDLNPSNNKFLVILEIEFNEYDSCSLGFIVEHNHWISVQQDNPCTMCCGAEPLTMDIIPVASMTYSLE